MKLFKFGLIILIGMTTVQSFGSEITGKVTELDYLRNREWNLIQVTITPTTGAAQEFAIPVGATLSAAWGNFVLSDQDVNRFLATLSTAAASGMKVRLVYFIKWDRPAGPNYGKSTMDVPEFVILTP
jgi:hypothetical protein